MNRHVIAAAMIGCASAAAPLAAQEQSASLAIELNAVQPSERGCRFTFVVENGLETALSKAAFEIVLFDNEGMVERLTLVDFQDLPSGKTKVRQFDFPELDCASVGRVLINDATECAGEGVAPGACVRELETSTRTDITFGT